MTGVRIAVVGMACRYPDATGPGELWQNVLGRRRSFRRIPEGRLSERYRGARDDPDAVYATHAAVLRDWEFDRSRFGIPGPLHRAADHTHWLALETAADALADSGFPGGAGLDRDATGVVLGNSLTGEFSRAATVRFRWPFIADAAATALTTSGVDSQLAGEVLRQMENLVKQPFPVPGDETLSGALANTIAGRICNYFDFHGTGYTVDGACSSSLLAVNAACRALTVGELDFALAGGVDMSLDPLELVGFARLGALAVDRMRVYDERPTGFLPGEGCGIVALMRAEDADRAGLRSYAHVVGWASSSDGSGGLTRPERRGQVLAMRRAYAGAGLAAESVQLIEGHGTGTAVGDRVELEALAEVRGPGAFPAALGTIKANIGHTKAAAGVAGFLKAALAVYHRVLPPTTGCERPHELLRAESVPLRVLGEPEPWPTAVPRAAVSSMGFGGINAHVVLEGVGAPAMGVLPSSVRRWSRHVAPVDIVLVGADSPARLGERLAALEFSASALSTAEVGDVAGTAWREGAGDGQYRAALVAATPDELSAAAGKAAIETAGWNGRPLLDEAAGFALGSVAAPRVGLLFPGQASPVRRDLPTWAIGLGVPDLPADLPTMDETSAAQPAIVRQSLAALAWLGELGTVAVAACGHSLGELTALYWAGACDSDAILGLAAERGRIMAGYGKPGTAMASLSCSAARAETLLVGTDAVVAGHNAPDQTVVAGSRGVIATVVNLAVAAGISATILAVSHGFHSEAMRPAVRPLRQVLSRVRLSALERPVVSTITGKELPAGCEGIRALLAEQLTGPVLFADALPELARRCDLLLEAGPGTILGGLVRANGVPLPVVSMDCGGDPRRHAFATAALAACHVADLEPWFAGRAFRRVPLDAQPAFVINPCENRAGWVAAAELPSPRPRAVAEAPPVPAATSDGPLDTLLAHLVETLELPAESIRPSSSLLSDLHLNSLQVVQVVAAVTRTLGKRPPDMPLSLVEATVADVAHAVAGLPSFEGPDPEIMAGVRPWVRSFTVEWTPFAPSSDAGSPGEVITLAGQAGPDEIAELFTRIAADPPERLVIIHYGHPAAAGVARSVAVELESCDVVVVQVPESGLDFDPGLLADPLRARYLELRRLADGSFERARMIVREPASGGQPALEPGGLCLVTGGVRGITAHAAAALAERTGCALLFTGRTPADDPEVSAKLAELRQRLGEDRVDYEACDAGDDTAVGELVRRRGPITGFIHGAGVNTPRRLAEITGESLTSTLHPKVSGLDAVLRQAGAELRLVLGFGSIIGRQGLAGQAEYCVANDWQRVRLERWAAEHPRCRTHVLEWSLWSGVGMGVRMDVVDALQRRGVEPIEPDLGAAALLELLDDPDAPVTVLLSSRFPASGTLSIEGAEGLWPRFVERAPVHVPGVEAVVEADLSLGSDPYLTDHRIGGTPVLPAVVGMEAMVQAGRLAGGPDVPLSLAGLDLRAPVTVDEPDGLVVRVAALAGSSGTDTVLRDSSDGFAAVRFAARIEPADEPPPAREPAVPPAVRGPHPWYGNLFFHNGRFRRLAGYDELSAFAVRAWLTPPGEDRWFSDFHDGRLLLGDPGVHDAALHVLLACVPHRRALPVGVDRVSVWREPVGPLRVFARERAHGLDEYEFDVDLVEPDGTAVARWDGLRLRAVGPLEWPDGMPSRLIGPWLSRRLIECAIDDHVELWTGGDPLVARAEGGGWRCVVSGVGAGGSAERQVRAIAEATGGVLAGKSPEVDEVTADGLVIARSGALRLVCAPVVVRETGVQVLVGLVEETP